MKKPSTLVTSISVGRREGPTDLVDRLLECHGHIRRFIGIAQRVATEEGASDEHIRDSCAAITRYFRDALPLHIADEEESILPRLRGKSTELDEALDSMVHEHQQHESELTAFLLAVAEVLVLGDSRRDSAKVALLDASRGLECSFAEHLALEESIIFPAIRETLAKDIEGEILFEIRKRRSSVP